MSKRKKVWLMPVLLMALILSWGSSTLFRAGCSSDPDRYLVFDALTLVEDFYIDKINLQDLQEAAMKGFALELALRDIKKKREEKEKAEKEKADKDTGIADEKKPESPAPNKSDEAKPDKPEDEQEAKNDPLYDIARGTIESILKMAPFTVSRAEADVIIDVDGQQHMLPPPKEKDELIDGFFIGYQFLCTQLGIGPEDREFLYAGIDGMMRSLDPHSSFLPPDICSQLKSETSGSFAGVGIEIGIRRERLTVIAPIVGTPAYNAGLKPMDKITKIDGQDTLGMSLMKAVELIRGEKGTTVVLTIVRKDVEKSFDVPLVRAKIDEHAIKHKMLPGNIGHIQIYKFNEMTISDLERALRELDSEPGKMKGLVLDLRGNPGGLLDQAVEVADKFIESGMIVNTLGRGMFEDKRRFAKSSGTLRDLPLICLINLQSASGSEIVAGALQDHKRALLLGTRTFGKGSVQSIFRLPADSCLRLTTARYFTPSNRSIQATGIVPDIGFLYPDEEERILEGYTEKALIGHLESSKTDPEATPKHNFEIERVFDYFEKKGLIKVDPDFPEKSDWLLVLAKQTMQGQDLSHNGMYLRVLSLLKDIPEVIPEKEADLASAQ